MTEPLQEARDDLEEAAKTVDDDGVREDIRETSDAFADYVMGDAQPDHAILDERLNALRQVRERTDGVTESSVESAIESVEDYRKGIDQA